ncbi:phospholipase A [Arcobacter sp. F2176]|uniref:phospholipase A n=1 Tax=unclassified Arcobacter TaxID=2593671 RepID=UPI00100A956F|nr:phospholipase A [Arcobacter sp. F2176]RXJ79242.1 phospholipase [Arcobacter sp. F2176]
MRQIFILIFLITTIFANENNDELYAKAKKYEDEHNYKEAMLIYKQIAKNGQKKVSTLDAQTKTDEATLFIDKDKLAEVKATKKVLNPIEDKETNNTLSQILASSFDLYPYDENYLLPFSYTSKSNKDRKHVETVFQLSVKKPITYNFFGLKESINFGYTQTSWWQLYSESSPFRETNYRPEVFVTIPYGKKGKTYLKSLKFGFLHESNGQGKEDSRSWNRLYAQSYFQFSSLFFSPRVWYRIPDDSDDDNPDIEDYLGYGDLTFYLPYKTHTFKLLLRNNLKFDDSNKGFAQFNWSFPLWGSKNTFGFVQLSSGYGDSLIDYNKEVNRISFGISLSR